MRFIFRDIVLNYTSPSSKVHVRLKKGWCNLKQISLKMNLI
jgi:hypothetical protein